MMSVVLVLLKPLDLKDQFICFYFEMLKSVSELTKKGGAVCKIEYDGVITH